MKEAIERTCIVKRQAAEPDDLIRFVVGPDASVVPDLRRKLPGRGCWVTANREMVDRAALKSHFERAFKTKVVVPADLGLMVDGLLVRAALGALGLARKAGAIGLGATKVESSVRSGKALAVLHAFEASEDGVRKISQARRAVVHMEGPDTPAYKLFSESELGLAIGGTNVIHAAVLAGEAGKAALKRMVALDRYRGGTPGNRLTVAAPAAEDTE
ncbi:RNA-binding protein [Mesorhizobium sp. NBSH29]|uniref:RNA-binding protein n=1 Tax=Mesorhizobium sp. NBSH29 TaxID=2654249 RepID=UPI00189699F8|nr:RNA-binding protein [Mesorhizobium sp. NBSH29]QPC86524.1 RNA-binding protein [Mesorhizobium sp. NBSH29]